ncbi:MAG: type II toxin-antitoxin system ParD family antitoxin [Candidatus Brockarchaeota archaeon]|nr:type II toxin-antitoxin system ParD family antitoxin [Candidatus Brockarchaeota archaeon]
MLKVVTVKLPERLVNALDVLVKQGQYPNRSEAIRAAIRDLIKKELSA